MQEWEFALYNTPIWLWQTFLGVIGIASGLIILLRRTTFCQQFAQVVRICLDDKNSLKALLLIISILTFLLLEVRFSVLNTFFYNGIYTSLEKRNFDAFWFFALTNAVLLGVRIFNGLINQYLVEVLQIKWLERFNHELLQRWLNNKNYYRLQIQRPHPDNIDQRIQQDAQEFIKNTVDFVKGMVNSVVSAVEFTLVLWGLSGVLMLFGVEIPRGMVFFVFVFVLLATVGAVWIGRPLIRLNFDNERLNGDYRFSLIRVREYAESIAFYNGENNEHANLKKRFAKVIENRWRIVYRTLGLTTFNEGITKGVQLLPLMIQAPRFFAGNATIGDMHQTVQAFTRLQRALSFFRNFYESFTAYQARLDRLNGFLENLEVPKNKRGAEIITNDKNSIILENVSLYLNDGKILLQDLNVAIHKGDALLIQGASGSGKTSLLKTLAGIWYSSSGKIICPSEMMFLPQRPYMPQGTLREAICYPNINEYHPDLHTVLRECSLAHLITHLDEVDDWLQRFSGGELQRIAFARVFLSDPKVVLLDEATSALDEPTEAKLYALLRERMKEKILISIGHRNTLKMFHNREIRVEITILN